MQLSYQIIRGIYVLIDLDDLAARYLLQVLRMDAEYGVWSSGSGPDKLILKQVSVDQRGDRSRETNRRHSADGKSGVFTHKIRLRAQDRLVDHLLYEGRIHPIAAAHEDKNGVSGVFSAEDERFDDRSDRTTYSLGSFRGCASGIRQFKDLTGNLQLGKRVCTLSARSG